MINIKELRKKVLADLDSISLEEVEQWERHYEASLKEKYLFQGSLTRFKELGGLEQRQTTLVKPENSNFGLSMSIFDSSEDYPSTKIAS